MEAFFFRTFCSRKPLRPGHLWQGKVPCKMILGCQHVKLGRWNLNCMEFWGCSIYQDIKTKAGRAERAGFFKATGAQMIKSQVPDFRHRVLGFGVYPAGVHSCIGLTFPCWCLIALLGMRMFTLLCFTLDVSYLFFDFIKTHNWEFVWSHSSNFGLLNSVGTVKDWALLGMD